MGESMTFEQLLTENGTKPELAEYIYKFEKQSQYWDSCVSFFNQNHQKKLSDMTQKQAKWAAKISEDVLEKYLENR